MNVKSVQTEAQEAPNEGGERWEQQLQRHLRLFTNFGVGFTAYYCVQSHLLGGTYLPLVHAFSFLSMFAAWLLARKVEDHRWAAITFLIALNNMLVVSSLFDGVTQAPGLWTVGLIPMASAFLLNFRATVAASVVAVADVVLVALAEKNFSFTREIEPALDQVMALLVINVFLFSVFSYLSSTGAFLRITALEERKAMLEQANEESVRAYKEKEVFLAKMSHELRTPMNGLLGNIREIQSRRIPSRIKELLWEVRRDAENLLVSLDLCLDSSQSELSSRLVQPQITDLRDCLNEVRENTCFLAGWEALAIEVESVGPSLVCQADPQRIVQVMSNLVVDLPVAYIPKEPRLKASVMSHSQDAHPWVRFWILIDPLPNSDLEAVISMVDVEQKLLRTSLNEGGDGLARAVCLQLIHDMGGIPLFAGVDESTLVGFRIPFVAAQKAPEHSQEAVFGGEPARVLVVDDNQINLKVASMILKKHDCVVDVAENGRVAVHKCAAQHYDLIFMDVRMPEMNGLEATQAIRSNCPNNARTPIIALTANAYESDKKECLDAGMNEHLAKPIKPDVIRRVLAKHIQNSDPQAGLEENRCA